MSLMVTSPALLERLDAAAAVAAHARHRALTSPDALGYARHLRGERALQVWRGLDDLSAVCWDADGSTWPTRARLSELRWLFELEALHPEGGVVGHTERGEVVFVIERAERETHLTLYLHAADDPERGRDDEAD